MCSPASSRTSTDGAPRDPARPLRGAGRLARGRRRADQEGLSRRSRASCTPTSTPRTPRPRRSSRRPPRPTRSSPTPSAARPTTATDTRACAPAATSRTSTSSARSRTSSRRSSAAVAGAASSAVAARHAARWPAATSAPRSSSSSPQAATGGAFSVSYETVARCEHCRGNGAEPGTPIETCERCGGAGPLQAVTRTPFGQMMRTVVCDTCGGDGRVAVNPCGECRGRGRVMKTGSVTRRGSRRASPTVSACASAAAATPASAAARPATSTCSSRVREDERFVREGDDLVTVLDVPAPLAALGASFEVADARRPRERRGRARHPARRGDHAARPGRAAPARPRPAATCASSINVQIPRRLSDEQRAMLEQFSRDDHRRRTCATTSRCSRGCGARCAATHQ